MGAVYGKIKLANPVKPELEEMEVTCLVDTGSTFLCIPPRIALQMGIKTLETRDTTLADGSIQPVPYGGPIHVKFGNRSCFVGALIFGDEVLLGQVPMEDMDLVVHPQLLQLAANPESPNIPRCMAKCS